MALATIGSRKGGSNGPMVAQRRRLAGGIILPTAYYEPEPYTEDQARVIAASSRQYSIYAIAVRRPALSTPLPNMRVTTAVTRCSQLSPIPTPPGMDSNEKYPRMPSTVANA
jgi:hypothetical protein